MIQESSINNAIGICKWQLKGTESAATLSYLISSRHLLAKTYRHHKVGTLGNLLQVATKLSDVNKLKSDFDMDFDLVVALSEIFTPKTHTRMKALLKLIESYDTRTQDMKLATSLGEGLTPYESIAYLDSVVTYLYSLNTMCSILYMLSVYGITSVPAGYSSLAHAFNIRWNDKLRRSASLLETPDAASVRLSKLPWTSMEFKQLAVLNKTYMKSFK